MAMSTGELRQYASSQSLQIDEADYFHRICGKTASLFAMCCAGAAIVSDQSEEQIAALQSFGMNLGIAFQIADDVLDFAGDEATLGKPAGNDLRQGTITLPAILFAEGLHTASHLRAEISEGKNLDEVVTAVRKSGALEAALQRAGEYLDVARAALDVFSPSEAKDALLNLAEHVVTRQR
jgi:geranylgeranyl pyrophosphate synthase